MTRRTSGPLVDDVQTGHTGGPGGRRQQGGEDQDGRRLARSVGPQEAVDLARRDPQVDPVDRPYGALEVLDQAFDLDAVLPRVHATAFIAAAVEPDAARSGEVDPALSGTLG
jgi:hypothetical protein